MELLYKVKTQYTVDIFITSRTMRLVGDEVLSKSLNIEGYESNGANSVLTNLTKDA